MKIFKRTEEAPPKVSEADLLAAARRVLAESEAADGPHPELEEWEALHLQSEEVSPERRATLRRHLEVCDRCFAEYQELTAFLAPISRWQPWRTCGKAAALTLLGGLLLWTGVQRNPPQPAQAGEYAATHLSALWLYPAGSTRSADSSRLPDLEIEPGRAFYDLKLFLDKNRLGLFRAVVLKRIGGSTQRLWSSPGLPVIQSAELPLRVPARVLDTEGPLLVELRKVQGELINVYQMNVVESPE